MMHPLQMPLMAYPWGSKSFIQNLLGRKDLLGLPVAEIWMGAHPSAPSTLRLPHGIVPLDIYLKTNPQALGSTAHSFDTLPYLMKVLAADSPLSIQTHPNLNQAQEGFAAENAQGIPLDDPTRNYKDANHKPELICALTPFTALCLFRPYMELTQSLIQTGLQHILPPAKEFMTHPSADTWKECFAAILQLKPSDIIWAIQTAIEEKDTPLSQWQIDATEWVKNLADKHPADAGALAPLFFQLHHLQPGQALFLSPGTPHAYLQGAAIEVMANSDNVLRGGLTSKHIDLPEYIRVLDFEPRPQPVINAVQDASGVYYYASPAREFRLGYATLSPHQIIVSQPRLPAIFLCTQGHITLDDNQQKLSLKQGESAFCDAQSGNVALSGEGMAYICELGS